MELNGGFNFASERRKEKVTRLLCCGHGENKYYLYELWAKWAIFSFLIHFKF
jgi:hypothetical protein